MEQDLYLQRAIYKSHKCREQPVINQRETENINTRIMFVTVYLITQKAIHCNKIKIRLKHIFLQESIKYTFLLKINGDITHKYLDSNNATITQFVMGIASLITQISEDRMLVINYIHYTNKRILCPRNNEVYHITQVLKEP
jgi:hypothetical protein